MNRPECFELAMDFLGEPEEAEIRLYIENLERVNECAKIDNENYKVGRKLQNEGIDELNHIIEEQDLELKILRRSRCSGTPA